MIKKPEAVLDRLASDQRVTEIPNIALSKFLYCNGQALPLPRVSYKGYKLQSNILRILSFQ